MSRSSLKSILAGGTAVILFQGAPGLLAQSEEKPTIAVLPFSSGQAVAAAPAASARKHARVEPERNNRMESEIYQCVMGAFFDVKRFRLIERAQLDQVMGEGKFQSSSAVDDASAVSLGKQLGAKYVILGSYTANTEFEPGTRAGDVWYKTSLRLSLRLVGTENGSVENVYSAAGQGQSGTPAQAAGDALKSLARDTSRQIANSYPLSGYVIRIDNEKEALIDIGKKDGIAVGDILLAFEKSPDIVHPVTGKIIKGDKRPISEFKVLSTSDNTSAVKMVGNPIGLKVGILLESKPRTGGLFEGLRNALK